MAEDRIVKFCAWVDPRSVKSCDYKLWSKWAWSRSCVVLIFLAKISVSISKTVQDRSRYTYNGRLIGNRTWPIKWQQRQWPWMTLNVIHRLQAFSNAIRRSFMQHFRRLQLTLCSRYLYVSWTFRMNRETTVNNNKIRKALSVNLRPLLISRNRYALGGAYLE